MSTSSSSASEFGPPLPHFSAPAQPLRSLRPARRVPWDRPRALVALLLALAVGIAVDQAATTDIVGLAGTAACGLAVFALAVTLRPRGWALVALILAGATTPWLTLRSSVWLVFPNLVAVGALMMLASGRTTPPGTFLAAARRLCAMVPSAAAVPAELRRAVQYAVPEGSPQRRLAAFRGLLVGVPIAGLLVVLLASGDKLFATLLGAPGLGAVVNHAVVALLAAAAWFALVVNGMRPPHDAPPSSWSGLGTAESTVVLATVSSVLAVYVGTTLAAAAAGRSYVERHTGLTYAQYARSGFFQLVAVVAIVVAVLITLRSSISGVAGGRGRLSLALLAATLTLAVVAVSIMRLQTYRSVFGLTMLRLSTTVFAAWLGVVLLLVSLSLVWRRFEPWLVSGVVLSCFVTLMALNVANPEAAVAKENIDRADRVADDGSGGFDGRYLTEHLGDDAVPTIATRLTRLDPAERDELLFRLCSTGEGGHGWSWNLSRHRAARSRAAVCRSESSSTDQQVVVGN